MQSQGQEDQSLAIWQQKRWSQLPPLSPQNSKSAAAPCQQPLQFRRHARAPCHKSNRRQLRRLRKLLQVQRPCAQELGTARSC